jgi:copper homeostasis protein (lipoprotein)
MKRSLLLLALLATLAATACKPQAPATTEPAAQANTAAEAPGPAAVESAPSTSAAEVPFDTKGFAGTFAAGDTKVILNADGTYKLAGATQADGTWTAEENGKRIRLDPNTKAEEDRLYTVVSHEQIDQVDASGAPVSPAQSLVREAAAK